MSSPTKYKDMQLTEDMYCVHGYVLMTRGHVVEYYLGMIMEQWNAWMKSNEFNYQVLGRK